ncbi:universal stress protein [Salidesulfovibrio brasiliensis]|uniref:universal stress protein n=1 Tax=Salidesulfovibrio brasiliensis TaxID=221711 RepID=UPI0006D2931D|nr:universal stress protein [Salidesulfovibrio brasiliensis]
MEKHILLTVSEGAAASYSLRFVNSFFESFDDTRFTLLYVIPRPMRFGHEGNTEAMSAVSAMKRQQAKQTVENARKWLVDFAGCPANRLETKIITSHKGTVREIIEESRRGLYDCTTIGRKAYSWVEELIEDSVTHGIMWKEIDFPLWICRQPPETPRRNVLLCTDGSAPSLRMADHVGYMLQHQPQHKVTVLHVKDGGSDGPDSEEIFENTRAALAENGITEERTEYKAVTAKSVDKAILSENAAENYIAVALGKRNIKPGKMDTFFPGSLSIRLLRQLESTALWISK